MVYNYVILCLKSDWLPCSVWPTKRDVWRSDWEMSNILMGYLWYQVERKWQTIFQPRECDRDIFVCIFSKKVTNKSIYDSRHALSGFIHSQKRPLKSCPYIKLKNCPPKRRKMQSTSFLCPPKRRTKKTCGLHFRSVLGNTLDYVQHQLAFFASNLTISIVFRPKYDQTLGETLKCLMGRFKLRDRRRNHTEADHWDPDVLIQRGHS